jgi:peptidyl-prolyl cis-trans isomerase D
MDDKSANLLSAKAEELRKKAVSGTPLETIATEIGQQVAVKRGVRRDANDAELGEQVVEAAFSGAQGLIGVGPGPDGKAQILFKVDEVAEPAGASAQSLPENARDAAGDALSNDLLDQFVGRLQGTYPVTVNEAAVNAALRY